jgi:hypothetical protein
MKPCHCGGPCCIDSKAGTVNGGALLYPPLPQNRAGGSSPHTAQASLGGDSQRELDNADEGHVQVGDQITVHYGQAQPGAR